LVQGLDLCLDFLFFLNENIRDIGTGKAVVQTGEGGKLHAEGIQLPDLNQTEKIFFRIGPVAVFLPFGINEAFRIIITKGGSGQPCEPFQLADG
jgi:hypothetical protein